MLTFTVNLVHLPLLIIFYDEDRSTPINDASGSTEQPLASVDQATHAAAHIVAALVLGVPVRGADTSFQGHPYCDVRWAARVKETNDSEGYEAYCAILYAPYFVETKRKVKVRASLDDRVAFEEIVEQHFPERRRVLMIRSKYIVEDHYEEIVRLAELLNERKELSAEEMVEFWNQRSRK